MIRIFKITEEDLKFIHGNDYEFFKSKILSNCHCPACLHDEYQSTIINYTIFLERHNDVILKGFCAKCGGKINRYLETGEVKEYLLRINQIRGKYALKSWRAKQTRHKKINP